MRRWRFRSLRQGDSEEQPDHLLVAAAQQDMSAFGALYDRYFPVVYGYCLRELHDPELAADAAGQTFLKAMAAIERYREGGRFRSWLFVIAHNAIIDARPIRSPEQRLDAVIHLPSAEPDPEQHAIDGYDLDRLDQAIARLPDTDRQVIELRRAGLNGREIAAVLGIAHEAAKKRQVRAMDRLREDLRVPETTEARRGA